MLSLIVVWYQAAITLSIHNHRYKIILVFALCLIIAEKRNTESSLTSFNLFHIKMFLLRNKPLGFIWSI